MNSLCPFRGCSRCLRGYPCFTLPTCRLLNLKCGTRLSWSSNPFFQRGIKHEKGWDDQAGMLYWISLQTWCLYHLPYMNPIWSLKPEAFLSLEEKKIYNFVQSTFARQQNVKEELQRSLCHSKFNYVINGVDNCDHGKDMDIEACVKKLLVDNSKLEWSLKYRRAG